MIKKTGLVILLNFLFLLSSGQFTNGRINGQPIGGIINSYTEILAFDACDNSLLVTDSRDFKVGDTVVIIQMKGAVIDSSNTAAFGTVTDYRSAGNYEFNYISSMNGNRVVLRNYLVNTYNIPDGSVQLVRVPYFNSVTVTSPLTCLPWDGGKGGILILNVADSIDLQANVDLSGRGFRGGALETLTSDCNDTGYYYGWNSSRAALKGEGIVNLAADKTRGRGAAANGGGSGNDHNSGGAGGANGGTGGNGGKEFICVAPLQKDNGGIGGNPLVYNNGQQKIFMGGGGGAGDANNFNSGVAGPGGGIAIFRARIIVSNNSSIISRGINGGDCTNDCWDGQSGGGAGGAILLDYTTLTGILQINTNGGNGGNVQNNNTGLGYSGPGGGGGGGVLLIAGPALPAQIVHTTNGGVNGAFLNDNTTGGASPGADGRTLLNAAMPFSTNPFSKNVDSVRMNSIALSCNNFSYEGIGYTRHSPVVSWEWTLGDGNSASTQDVIHTYLRPDTYVVKLVGTDDYGCRDSVTRSVTVTGAAYDFNYSLDACNPQSVQFTGVGDNLLNAWWSLGDGTIITGILSPVHTYAGYGNYIVRFYVEGACDTLTKIIALNLQKADFVITPDTTICLGIPKQLRAKDALSYCWRPAAGLDNPAVQNPVTSTTQNTTYFLTAQVPGTNLIVNGDFSGGATGFTSAYNLQFPNTKEGEYFVGVNPQTWNPNMGNCMDHTTGNGNMLLVNGAPVSDQVIWQQTVSITPHTNYAFSTWIQSAGLPNAAELQFSINGINLGNPIIGSQSLCTWVRFFTTWNSGSSTSAVISIVNRNLTRDGNDFAMDDISFAPVIILQDSVTITVDKPAITASNDTTVCKDGSVQLNATGAATYRWSPAAGLSNPSIANPVANPASPTPYIVTGTTLSGCTAKDTVTIGFHPKPAIIKTNDTTICINAMLQLSISGGVTYLWSPAATLSNPAIANPIASPTTNITYHVTITDTHTCLHDDSVKVEIAPIPAFIVSPAAAICEGSTVQLDAAGGDNYTWSPATTLNDPSSAHPRALPITSTVYSVYISENKCNYDTTLEVSIKVNPNPVVTAEKSNDIDCSTPTAQLTATGAGAWLWSPPTGLNFPDRYNPIAAIDTSTLFVITGTNSFGCSAKDSVLVKVSRENIPVNPVANAFTPNNDGKNDCFGISKWGAVTLLEFSVYNRWGERIFTTKDPTRCWDGTYKGKNQDAGGYAYVIRARAFCGEVKRTGMVMLIR